MAVVFVMASPEAMSHQISPPGSWACDYQKVAAPPGSWTYDGDSQPACTSWQEWVKQPKNNWVRGSKKRTRKNAAEESRCSYLPTDEWTTVCFRNVPNIYNNTRCLELMDLNGFKDQVNFLYVPHDFKRLPLLTNLGYFFVNFVSHDAALRAWEKFDGYKDWEPASHKVLTPSWATQTQGLQTCIEKYQKSPVMHPDVPYECKPLLIENGKAIQLPSGGYNIKAPRLKTTTTLASHTYSGFVTSGASETAYEGAEGTPCARCEGDKCAPSFPPTIDGSSYGSEVGFAESNSGRTVWMPDDAVDACLKCDMPFTFLRRRHHCRACGLVFCAECAPRTNTLFPSLLAKRTDAVPYKRLCTDCATGLRQLSDESTLVIKNTFVSFPRSASIECQFDRRATSFPL